MVTFGIYYYVFWGNVFRYAIIMISSETPDKLAEIIRDTFPQLYRPFKDKKLCPPKQNDRQNLDCNE